MHIPVKPEHYRCPCGAGRKLHTNEEGLRILRCVVCEPEDVVAWLRLQHGPESSRQFWKSKDERKR